MAKTETATEAVADPKAEALRLAQEAEQAVAELAAELKALGEELAEKESLLFHAKAKATRLRGEADRRL